PKGNKVKGKFGKSQDLRRRFARDIRAEHRRELAMLLGRELVGEDESGKRRDKVGGRTPILAAYFTIPTRLRATHRGRKVRAHVSRDGTIRFAGKVYNSPSAAGFRFRPRFRARPRPCRSDSLWFPGPPAKEGSPWESPFQLTTHCPNRMRGGRRQGALNGNA